MAVGQLPDEIREFAKYLNDLLARIDRDAGWCGVFLSRDPDGMRACLDGAEVPPWDVVQALLHDLAADAGVGVAHAETARARALHAASVAAHDDRPGTRELLSERLDLMLQEQRFALERQQELARALAVAPTPDDVDRIHLDLAWVRDDHERAAARCGELRARIDRLDRASAPQWVDFGGPGQEVTPPRAESGHPSGHPSDHASDQSRDEHAQADPPDRTPRVPHQSDPRRRPRGARFAGFAGFDADEADGVGAIDVPLADGAPVADGPPGAPGAPRGARYAQAMDTAPRAPRRTRAVERAAAADREAADARAAADAHLADEHLADERVTVDAVRALLRLRGEGRSGEAHGVLVEAAGWPAARLPLFAEELHHAGLAADWATLLWEAASLPPDRLVAVADALAGAGRAEDCRKLLRQGVARPAPEIAESLIALADAGRTREARALLDAFVLVRSAEDVAACAHTDPPRLIPQLLEAARAASDERHWDLVHALRVAGFTT
ncbi:hypothetical protein [Streptomyces flavofungini]|uniref:UL36 very large tegument protein n=1 Tax=Streptomyces flavofungini TaxID=68200 RepID=A0ABS0X563_9ACTN|nr:hypothetical protein [Streptomyces flavofungini]MBJ3808236.1 hypothetical protein [Streptomyces flavofungini]GHC57245.1 hypothetical protein GCM10010349_25110 [Streptomyces flavofungini]